VNSEALAKFQDGTFGGTLVVALAVDADSLDPHIGFIPGRAVTLHTNEGAVTRDRAYNTVPTFDESGVPRMYGIAKSIKWEGDSTLVFEFQEGAKFHDGTPFNAEAALFNYRRIWDPEFEYFYPEGNATRSDIGQLVADDGRAMEVRDEYMLAITLKQRSWDFLDWMSNQGSYDFSSPTAIKEVGNEEMGKHPVGTGPFKFVEWVPNVRIVLEANDDYWGGRPFIDKLIMIPIPDAGARMAAVLSGEVDIAYAATADFVDELEANLDVTLYTRGKASVIELGPNYEIKDSPLQNEQVRKALSMAIDRQGMADVLLKGTAFPAGTFSSPSAGTHDPNVQVDEFNLEEAKKLLTEAGYPDGLELNLFGPTSGCGTDTVGIGEYVQSTWSEIGVQLDLEMVDFNTMLGQWIKGGADPANMVKELTMLCMGLDSPFRVKNAFSKDQWSPSGWNSSHYYNPEVEELLTKMSKAISYEDYIGYAREAEAVARAETSHLWTVHDGKPIAVNNRVKGWKPAKEWADDFSRVWIEE
jgi:peptide/nickel transport system substrate-binding protein